MANGCIVMKFGGTSVGDAKAILRVCEIVRGRLPQRPIVVVSARGDTHDIVAALEASTKYTLDVLRSFDEDQAATLRGTTKWTLKETLGHLCDAHGAVREHAHRTRR